MWHSYGARMGHALNSRGVWYEMACCSQRCLMIGGVEAESLNLECDPSWDLVVSY
jgi:hypothetical protein